jgi:hypothetical protein
LSEFFPEGALALVDDIRITSCGKPNPLADWLRQHIAASFGGREIPADALKFEQEQLLKSYYIPHCLSRIPDILVYGRTYDLSLKIIVAPDGSVSSCSVKGKEFVSAASKKPLINEIKTWKFPTDGQKTDTLSFSGKFIKNQ